MATMDYGAGVRLDAGSDDTVVRADGGATVVKALDPRIMVRSAGDDALAPVADEAVTRLSAALASLVGRPADE